MPVQLARSVESRKVNEAQERGSADDLRKARVLAADCEDGVHAARAAYEQLQASATTATAAANRANDRRRAAINEVVRPECARLMRTAERLTKELGEARLAMKFVSGNLTGDYGDERGQINRFLNLDLSQLFPGEFGFRAALGSALAAWRNFAEAVARDPETPFPT